MTIPAMNLASKSLMLSTGASVFSGAATTLATNAAQVHQGWAQLYVKEVDMASAIPGKVTIPPVVRPG